MMPPTSASSQNQTLPPSRIRGYGALGFVGLGLRVQGV